MLPVALLYGLAVTIRHKLFDWKILPSESFDLPLICVGNITVGGTGKTPHVEYLVKLLKEKYKVAILSRGYKRKTRGYQAANKKSTPNIIGDEPYQIYRKHPDITVAVCEKRVEGISNLLQNIKQPEVIILDDAFQHRYVKPGLNIVLIDFNRPIFKDHMLPAGNLRDRRSQLKRADIVIVSKTPKDITPLEKRLWIKNLKLFPYQKLFFSYISYSRPKAIFQKKETELSLSQIKKEDASILLVTGIANPLPIIEYLKQKEIDFKTIKFPDHHNFSESDLDNIKNEFKNIKGRKKIILTTEKDAVRIKHLNKVPGSLKDRLYYLPIKIKFIDNGNKGFDKIINGYVRKNKKIG
jgi:tetraacyldisaccharide 4'-kinase